MLIELAATVPLPGRPAHAGHAASLFLHFVSVSITVNAGQQSRRPDRPARRDKGHPDSSPPSTPLSPVVSRKVTEHCSNFKEENMDTSR